MPKGHTNKYNSLGYVTIPTDNYDELEIIVEEPYMQRIVEEGVDKPYSYQTLPQDDSIGCREAEEFEEFIEIIHKKDEPVLDKQNLFLCSLPYELLQYIFYQLTPYEVYQLRLAARVTNALVSQFYDPLPPLTHRFKQLCYDELSVSNELHHTVSQAINLASAGIEIYPFAFANKRLNYHCRNDLLNCTSINTSMKYLKIAIFITFMPIATIAIFQFLAKLNLFFSIPIIASVSLSIMTMFYLLTKGLFNRCRDTYNHCYGSKISFTDTHWDEEKYTELLEKINLQLDEHKQIISSQYSGLFQTPSSILESQKDALIKIEQCINKSSLRRAIIFASIEKKVQTQPQNSYLAPEQLSPEANSRIQFWQSNQAGTTKTYLVAPTEVIDCNETAFPTLKQTV